MSAFISNNKEDVEDNDVFQWQYNDTYQAENVVGYEEGPIKVSNKSTSEDQNSDIADYRDGFKRQTNNPDETSESDNINMIYKDNAMISNDNQENITGHAVQNEATVPADAPQDTAENSSDTMPSTFERNFSTTSTGSRGEWDFIDSMENGKLIKKMIRSQDNQIRFMRAEIHTKNELIDSLLKIIKVLMDEQKNRRDTVYGQLPQAPPDEHSSS